MIHVDYEVTEDCINTYSYGMICVKCGCCSRNQNYRDRVIRRIRYYKECLKEKNRFDNWYANEYWRSVREKNAKSNIQYFKRKIRRYKKILKTLGGKE